MNEQTKMIFVDSEGSWAVHKKAVFSQKLKIKVICESCNNKFVVTRNSNIKIDECNIITGHKLLGVIHSKSLLPMPPSYYKTLWNYNRAKMYIAICPHCGYSEHELFCEPVGQFSNIEYTHQG